MKRKSLTLLCAACLLLTAILSGCRTETFEPAPPAESTTAAPTTSGASEGTTTAADAADFTFAANIKMGMTIAEVQAAIGQVTEVSIVDGRKSFSNAFSGIFMNYANTKPVIFMFNADTERLEQFQFRGSTDVDGADTATAVLLFDARYGKQGVYQRTYLNRIWQADGVYILLSELSDNEYAVTYSEKSYFERTYPEETLAYQRAR